MIDHVTPPTLIESKSAAENGHGRWFKAHGPLQGFSPISESSALSPSGGAYPVRKKLPGYHSRYFHRSNITLLHQSTIIYKKENNYRSKGKLVHLIFCRIRTLRQITITNCQAERAAERVYWGQNTFFYIRLSSGAPDKAIFFSLVRSARH